eukprot:scaffold9627_cov63-Attheya_sp.AAC.2
MTYFARCARCPLPASRDADETPELLPARYSYCTLLAIFLRCPRMPVTSSVCEWTTHGDVI